MNAQVWISNPRECRQEGQVQVPAKYLVLLLRRNQGSWDEFAAEAPAWNGIIKSGNGEYAFLDCSFGRVM